MQREVNRTRLVRFDQSLANKPREQHEVVVMDPDQRTLGDFFDNGICEDFVDFLVCAPWCVLEDLPGLVVKNWLVRVYYAFFMSRIG